MSVTRLWALRRLLIGWLIPVIWLPILLAWDSKEAKCAYVIVLMISYWFSEVIPMAITSLIPTVLFPLFEIVSSEDITKSYVNGTIMIMLGSFIAATAVEVSNLHERIALRVILATGTSPKRLLLGLMGTTTLLSMLVSNCGSTALMVPIVNAALHQLTRQPDQELHQCTDVCITMVDNKECHHKPSSINSGQRPSSGGQLTEAESRKLRNAMFLGICFASNIGGTGTITGTPVNLVLNELLQEDAISYSEWFFINFPGVFILTLFTWIYLCVFELNIRPSSKENTKLAYRAIETRYQKLGKIRFNELAVLLLFGFLIVLWFFRAPDFMTGWSYLFNENSQYIKDSLPTMLVVILFYLIPASLQNLESSPMLLDWKITQEKISWSVLLLLSGGFAMSRGFEDSGLSKMIGDELIVMESLPKSVITLIMCLIAVLLTELISNMAACCVLVPVITQMATAIGINPISIILPVTISCSYAFMLPFSSGPTAISYEASGMVSKEMIIPGFFVKLICLFSLLAINSTWGEYMIGSDEVPFATEASFVNVTNI